MRLLIAIFLSLALYGPALAQAAGTPSYVIQSSTGVMSAYYGSGTPATPSGGAVAVFTPFGGDIEVTHYSINASGILLYAINGMTIPPSISVLTEVLRNDSGITPAGRLELMRMRAFLLQDFYANPTAATLATLKSRWTQLKAADSVPSSADYTQAAADFANGGLVVQ